MSLTVSQSFFFNPKVLRALHQEVNDVTCDTYSKLCVYNSTQGSREICYVGHCTPKVLQPKGLFFITH